MRTPVKHLSREEFEKAFKNIYQTGAWYLNLSMCGKAGVQSAELGKIVNEQHINVAFNTKHSEFEQNIQNDIVNYLTFIGNCRASRSPTTEKYCEQEANRVGIKDMDGPTIYGGPVRHSFISACERGINASTVDLFTKKCINKSLSVPMNNEFTRYVFLAQCTNDELLHNFDQAEIVKSE